MIHDNELAEVSQIVDGMGCLSYFPSDSSSRIEIMRLTARMANSLHEVRALVRTMIDRVGVWVGPVEYRGVFCQLGFKPADGIRAECSLPGLAPAPTPEPYHLPAPALDKSSDPITPEELDEIRALEKRIYGRTLTPFTDRPKRTSDDAAADRADMLALADIERDGSPEELRRKLAELAERRRMRKAKDVKVPDYIQ
jgi:hypothetical protein